MNNTYGALPVDVCEFELDVQEFMFFMYLPIKLKADYSIKIPKRLMFLDEIINECIVDFKHLKKIHEYYNSYIYLTFKNIWVTNDNPGNRPGWHSDGFMTNDINYIWTNNYGTIFNHSHFHLANDCELSLIQMESQALLHNNVKGLENHLYRLDQFNIHKTPEIKKACMRAFFKLSFSNKKYNLKGNSKNYLLDYNWKMYSRDELRNHPNKEINNKDYINEE